MEARIRLDSTGSPYLVLTHVDPKKEETNALEDAEKLFFTQLSQNGAKLHVVDKGNAIKLLVVTNIAKRGFYKLEGEQITRPSILIQQQPNPVVPTPVPGGADVPGANVELVQV